MENDTSKFKISKTNNASILTPITVPIQFHFYIFNCHRLGGIPIGRDNFYI